MKKLMKAIAFATVMCMLLSVSAFAEVDAPAPTLGEDYNFEVKITGAASDQVALLVVKHDAVLTSLKDGDILYIDQDAATEGTATFNVSLVKANVTDDKVDIYAGYATANGEVATLNDYPVTSVKEISISLSGVEIIQDVEAWVKASENADAKAVEIPENDKATAVFATVVLNNFTGKNVVSKMGWEFVIDDGTSRFVQVNPVGFEAIETGSSVKVGVTFANGAKDNTRDALTVKDAHVYLFVDGKEISTKKDAK